MNKPHVLTIEKLRKMGACEAELDTLAVFIGEGVPLTEKGVLGLVRRMLGKHHVWEIEDWTWWLQWHAGEHHRADRAYNFAHRTKAMTYDERLKARLGADIAEILDWAAKGGKP